MDYSNLKPDNTPIVVIGWSDIVFDDQWEENPEDAVQPVESVTVGYLLEDSATMVVVASSYDYRADRWASIHAFPKRIPDVTIIKDQAPAVARHLTDIPNGGA